MAIGQTKAIPVKAIHFDNLAMCITPVTDHPALREHMQHALLVFGNIHWKRPEKMHGKEIAASLAHGGHTIGLARGTRAKALQQVTLSDIRVPARSSLAKLRCLGSCVKP